MNTLIFRKSSPDTILLAIATGINIEALVRVSPAHPVKRGHYMCFYVEPKNVKEAGKEQGLRILKIRRITSRVTNRPTSPFKIITARKETIDYPLSKGLRIFRIHHRCELSNAPPP